MNTSSVLLTSLSHTLIIVNIVMFLKQFPQFRYSSFTCQNSLTVRCQVQIQMVAWMDPKIVRTLCCRANMAVTSVSCLITAGDWGPCCVSVIHKGRSLTIQHLSCQVGSLVRISGDQWWLVLKGYLVATIASAAFLFPSSSPPLPFSPSSIQHLPSHLPPLFF